MAALHRTLLLLLSAHRRRHLRQQQCPPPHRPQPASTRQRLQQGLCRRQRLRFLASSSTLLLMGLRLGRRVLRAGAAQQPSFSSPSCFTKVHTRQYECVSVCACVRVCVCARARADVSVCLSVCLPVCLCLWVTLTTHASRLIFACAFSPLFSPCLVGAVGLPEPTRTEAAGCSSLSPHLCTCCPGG